VWRGRKGSRMKEAEWKHVKRGQVLIYADLDDGVQKAIVTEIDITVTVTDPVFKREQPYGLTADQGYVKIKYDDTEIVENLTNLIKFDLTVLRRLEQAWKEYNEYKGYMEEAEQAFKGMVTENQRK